MPKKIARHGGRWSPGPSPGTTNILGMIGRATESVRQTFHERRVLQFQNRRRMPNILKCSACSLVSDPGFAYNCRLIGWIEIAADESGADWVDVRLYFLQQNFREPRNEF